MSNAKFIKEIRTEWIKEWAAELLSGFTNLVTSTEIETYCKGKLEEFSTLCSEKAIARAKQQGEDEATVNWKKSAVSNLSGVRKAIKLWELEQTFTEENSYEVSTKTGVGKSHKALLYINYGRDFLDESKARGDEKKQAQRRNLTPITDVAAYQDPIEKACLSNEWRDLAVGIQAALGTRIGETLLTAQIKQLNQFQVQFQGQIKTKVEEREAYPKYTLIESHKVVDALLKLRRMAELMGKNTPYSGNEKLRRAIEAIKEYNERQPSKEQRWAITSTILQTLTGCRTAILKSYMDSDEGRINIHDYNQLHGFSYHHNKGKGSIADAIKFQ